jgi:hypothetical protein
MGVSIHPARSTIFSAWLLAELIIRQLLPCSHHYIFSPFNSFQGSLTLDLAMPLKRVEMFSPATFRIFLDRRPRRKIRTASLGLKRSVRVQPFTCSWSLTR